MLNKVKSGFFSVKILFLAFIMMISINLNGQWLKMSDGLLQSDFVSSLCTNGNYIYAGTTSGVYFSTNYGENWIKTALNNQVVTVVAAQGNNIYAGTNNGIYLSTNNGYNWILAGSNIRNVLSFCVSGNYIFAGTDAAGVFKSSNNGITWNQTSLNNRFIWAIAKKEIYLFAGGDGYFSSTDFGTTWSQSYLYNMITSIAIYGDFIYGGTNGFGVYLSVNNGITWTQTALINKSIYSLSVFNKNIFAGLVGSISDTAGVYLSTNYGNNWINTNQGLNFNASVRSLLIVGNYIFAGAELNSVWRRPLSELVEVQNIGTEIPSAYSLGQNYPNPFNPTTTINFTVPQVSSPHGVGGDLVQLKVYDVMGHEVKILVNESLMPGSYETAFDGSNLTSGIYLYQLTIGNYKETKIAILIK